MDGTWMSTQDIQGGALTEKVVLGSPRTERISPDQAWPGHYPTSGRTDWALPEKFCGRCGLSSPLQAIRLKAARRSLIEGPLTVKSRHHFAPRPLSAFTGRGHQFAKPKVGNGLLATVC